MLYTVFLVISALLNSVHLILINCLDRREVDALRCMTFRHSIICSRLDSFRQLDKCVLDRCLPQIDEFICSLNANCMGCTE